MDDIGTLSALLVRRYGARAVALRLLVRDGGKSVYLVEQDGQPTWLLRAAPPQARPAVFHKDAAVLAMLDRQSYPAPRVVPTLDGAAVTEWMQRPVLVTTFIAGTPTDFSPASLGRLGAALGQLHALTLPISPGTLPPAGMLPRPEIPAARSWLAEVRHAVPPAQRARFAQAEAVCHTLDLVEDLPTVLIHNDCHPGNSILTPDGRAVLVDWEGAGRGPAVVDVGFLLVSCEITAFGPNRLPPDPSRVAAVVDGYCRYHRLSPQELDRLPDAIRFRAIIACAGGLWSMIREGHAIASADWAWARYAAADVLAARARERFERYS